VAFAVGAIFFPTLLFLISMGIRSYKKAPVTSAVDFVGLALVFDGLLITDPSQILAHMRVNFSTEVVVSVTLLFLAISFAIWFSCLFDLEPRIVQHYKERHAFPLIYWLFTWAAALAVIVLQVTFFTGRVASWFS